MRRFLTMILLTILLLTCLSAFAEGNGTCCEEAGLAIGFSDVRDKSANCPMLVDDGMVGRDPFRSTMGVGYCALPKDAVEGIQNRIDSGWDGKASQKLDDALSVFAGRIAATLITNAKTLAETDIAAPLPEGYALTEPVDGLLASGAEDAAPEAGATSATVNEVGAYRVIVRDVDGNPVQGAVVQLCDDTTCSLQKTKDDGVATFQVEAQKVYEVHVAKVPEGYVSSDEAYMTLDTFSDVNITISRAE